jgi:hypothetical protein
MEIGGARMRSLRLQCVITILSSRRTISSLRIIPKRVNWEFQLVYLLFADAQLIERLAKLKNQTIEEVQNPRYLVSDKDEGGIPSTSNEILANLREPANVPLVSSKDEVNLPKRKLSMVEFLIH